MQDSAHRGRVLTIDGAEVTRLPDTGFTGGFAATQSGVAWTLDGRGVAVVRRDGAGLRTDVVIDGVVQAPITPGGAAGWSNEGLRLAIAEPESVIIDYETGRTVRAARGGTFPAWSESDRFVAMAIGDNQVPGMTVLDSVTGAELLRVYNPMACFDLYWSGETLLLGSEKALQMPEASW